MWLELLQSSLEEKFGEKLKETVKKLGMSVNDFAEVSKIPKGTLYKIISGERKNFRVSTLKQIIRTVRKINNL